MLQETNDNLLIEVATEFQQSLDTLDEVEAQQKTRENFLAQANASYEKADQAVKMSEQILDEAKKTLSTLKGGIVIFFNN